MIPSKENGMMGLPLSDGRFPFLDKINVGDLYRITCYNVRMELALLIAHVEDRKFRGHNIKLSYELKEYNGKECLMVERIK